MTTTIAFDLFSQSSKLTNYATCDKLINFDSKLAKAEYLPFKQITPPIGFYESLRIAFFGHFITHLPHSIQRA